MRLGSLGARSEGREDPKDFFPAALGTGSQLQARKSPRNEVTEVAGDSAGVPLSRRPPAVRARDKRARVGDGTPGFHPRPCALRRGWEACLINNKYVTLGEVKLDES
jgi:hypothetical protein